jgi:hypothetical protein
MKKLILLAGVALLGATEARAAPGVGSEVYGATAEAGKTELEARYDRLTGGAADGADVIKLEATHSVNDRLRVAVFGEFEREPGEHRLANSGGVEVIYTLGKAAGIEFAVYSEYALAFNGNSDALEAKLIMERRRGPFDLRLNLIGEKPLVKQEPVQLSYAAAANYALGDDIQVGMEAFGDLGTFSRFGPYAEHFIGPEASVEVEGLGPEIELNAGYLFALGKAREDTKGQLRLAVEVEF